MIGAAIPAKLGKIKARRRDRSCTVKYERMRKKQAGAWLLTGRSGLRPGHRSGLRSQAHGASAQEDILAAIIDDKKYYNFEIKAETKRQRGDQVAATRAGRRRPRQRPGRAAEDLC